MSLKPCHFRVQLYGRTSDTGDIIHRTSTLLTDNRITGLEMASTGIYFAGLGILNIKLGTGGNNNFTINVVNDLPMLTNVYAGIPTDAASLTYQHNLDGVLNLIGFYNAPVAQIGGNLNGTLDFRPFHIVPLITIGGGITFSGLLIADNITSLQIVGNMAGVVSVSGNLQNTDVGGSTPGLFIANAIGHVTAGHDLAPLGLNIREAGVDRQLQITPATTGTPNPVLKYYYQSVLEQVAPPTLELRVITPSTVLFDINLATYNYDPVHDVNTSHSSVYKFDLTRIDAIGDAGLHDITVEGDLLTRTNLLALTYFGLVSGSFGGIRMPLDNIGNVEARDYMAPASIQAATVQAVGFGEYLSNGQVVSNTDTSVAPFRRSVAATSDAFAMLVPGTKQVQANTIFHVAFGAYPVVFYMTTTIYPVFDSNYVMFVDQYVNDPTATIENLPANSSVLAYFNAISATPNSVIQAVGFVGDGGSIQTAQYVSGAITSSGPLGDVSLRSVKGITGNITAPRIFGSIFAPYGGITSTIQTTGTRVDPITGASSASLATLGRVYSDISTGTPVRMDTSVYSHGVMSGRIISRARLISVVTIDTNLTGQISSGGDIGVNDHDTLGRPARFGGVTITGTNSGQITSLNNIIGDISSAYFAGGRVAANGSILGNVNVSGTFDAASAIIARGSIGDVVNGTGLSVRNVSGIIAAEGNLNILRSGTLTLNSTFSKLLPTSSSNILSANAIDAIFKSSNMSITSLDVGFLDLANVDVINANLKRLRTTLVSGKTVLTDS